MNNNLPRTLLMAGQEIIRLEKERDEARAEVERLKAEVERLRRLLPGRP